MKNYIIHMRPKTFLPSFVFVLSGYALSPTKATEVPLIFLDLFVLFLSYSVFLFGGTCCLNSYYDRDTKPLNFLDHPPPIPNHLGWFGIVLMILGVLIVGLKGVMPMLIGLFAFLLSLAYNAPIPIINRRGKEIGGLDNVLDSLGCGIVGILLGYTITGADIDFRVIVVSIAFTITVFGSYPATQIFQLKPEDTYETARNFSTLFGTKNSLRIGALSLSMGFLVVIWIFSSTVPFGAKNSLSLILFGGFVVGYVYAIKRQWDWSFSPYKNSTKEFKSLISILLVSRLLWIAAEWGKTV